MKAWFDLGNGRKVFRTVPERNEKRSSLPMPMIKRDEIAPTKSMADGKEYTSLSGLRRTYRAENNPHGVAFTEVGNENIATFTPPKKDRKANREAIERAMNDAAYGNVPPVLTTDNFPL